MKRETAARIRSIVNIAIGTLLVLGIIAAGRIKIEFFWIYPILLGALLVYILMQLVFLSSDITIQKSKRQLMKEIYSTEHADFERMSQLDKLIGKYSVEKSIGFLKRLLDDPDTAMRIAAADHLASSESHRTLGLKHATGMLERDEKLKDGNRAALLDMLAKHHHLPSIDLVTRINSETRDSMIREKVLHLLETAGRPDAQLFLLTELKKGKPDMTTAIIDALAACGTAEAVEPLYRLSEKSRNPFIKSAVTKAIERIQARLGAAESGWLSPAPSSSLEGGLSRTDSAQEGALSIDKVAPDTQK